MKNGPTPLTSRAMSTTITRGRHTDRMVVGERLTAALDTSASSAPGTPVVGISLRRSFTLAFSTGDDIFVSPLVKVGKAVRPRWLGALVNSSTAASGFGRREFLQLLSDDSTVASVPEVGIDDTPVQAERWFRLVAGPAPGASTPAVSPDSVPDLPNWAARVRALRDGGTCGSVSYGGSLRTNSPISSSTAHALRFTPRVRGVVARLDQVLRAAQHLLLTGRRSDTARQSRNALLKRQHRSVNLSLLSRSPGDVVMSSGCIPRGPDSPRVTSVPVIRGELVRAA